jgi:hypothetical protein
MGKKYKEVKMKKSVLAFILLITILNNSSYAQWSVLYGPGDNTISLATDGNHLFAGTQNSGLMRYTFKSGLWETTFSAYWISSIFVHGTLIYATITGGNLIFSSDNGSNWSTIHSGFDNDLKMPSYYCIAGNDKYLFLGKSSAGSSFNYLMASSDDGVTWYPSDGGIQGTVYSIATRGDDVYAATYNGVYFSAYNGSGWINTGLTYVGCVEVSGENIYAGTYNNKGLYVSSNNGASWTLLTNGIPSNVGITCISAHGDYVFAGTYGGGVYFSQDNGVSWILFNDGLYNLYIRSILFDNSYVYTGTNSYIFKRQIIPTTSPNKVKANIPDKFSLSQNYPNPFNPSTIINYQLPIGSDVKLVVYDVMGREIKTLVNEKQNVGSYQVEFDGSNLASGVYFYKLQAESYTQVKKMNLIK